MQRLILILIIWANWIFSFAQTSGIKTFEYSDTLLELGQVHFLEVQFGFDDSGLSDDSLTNETIQDLGNFLIRNKNIVISIDCHTDFHGEESFNLKLSEKRAEQIYFVLNHKFGVDTTQVKINGFGESSPLFPESYVNQLGFSEKEKEVLIHSNRRILARIVAIKD